MHDEARDNAAATEPLHRCLHSTVRGGERPGHADHAPLLLRADGSPWGDNPGAGYHRDVNKIVTAIGADPNATMYALRHSSIARMLLQNVPIRLVASLHNTSVAMIERTYSKYITEYSDGVSRKALLQLPVGDTVAALAS